MEPVMVKMPPPARRSRAVWVGLAALALLLAVGAGGWLWFGRSAASAPSDVEVYASVGDPLCATRPDSPVFVGVINNSAQAIAGMTFVLAAQLPDGSGNAQSDFSYVDRTRIGPGEAGGDCWPVNYEAPYWEKNLDAATLKWSVARFALTTAP